MVYFMIFVVGASIGYILSGIISPQSEFGVIIHADDDGYLVVEDLIGDQYLYKLSEKLETPL